METKNINDLHGDPQNPRTISKQDFEALKKSIKEFGDLSGIVLNTTTGELVGGHQRIEAFKSLGKNAQVEIAQRLEAPTKTGTTAIGFVSMDGERYGYREVEWDKAKQQAANIAANRISGEFDVNLLAEVTYQIQQQNPELVELTGQTEKEVQKLMESIGVIDAEQPADDKKSDDEDEEKNELVFALTSEQSEFIVNVLEYVRINKDIPSSDSKAMNGAALYYIAQDYAKANPMPSPDEFNPPEIPAE